MPKRYHRRRFNAHKSFRNGADCDDRAMRRCRCCGGVQYDWGAGSRRANRLSWVMAWYCTGRGGCGLMQHEKMTSKRFMELRQTPPKIKRAPSAPWI